MGPFSSHDGMLIGPILSRSYSDTHSYSEFMGARLLCHSQKTELCFTPPHHPTLTVCPSTLLQGSLSFGRSGAAVPSRARHFYIHLFSAFHPVWGFSLVPDLVTQPTHSSAPSLGLHWRLGNTSSAISPY